MGLGAYCRPCHADYARSKRAAKPKQPTKRKGPAPRFSEPYEVRHREKRRLQQKEYYQRVAKERRQQQREELNTKAREYRSIDPEKHRERVRKWAKENPEKEAANKAKRRAIRRNATVLWADNAAIQQVYSDARALSEDLGVQFEVDHIIPLRGKLVCGLHWQGNLQIIPANDNRKKANKFAA